MTDQTLFVDVYVAATGAKQRVPREWLDDPKLGPPFRKTPSQRELDGELPARPAGDASSKEIEAFAEAAEIDLTGVKKNADRLVAIEEALGGPAPVQAGVIEAEAPEPVPDPLAPELVAHVDPQAIADSGPASSTPTPEDDTESSDDTAAAADKE